MTRQSNYVLAMCLLSAVDSTSARERLAKPHAALPLTFEANTGQCDPAVKFLSRAGGYHVFLTPDEAVLTVAGSAVRIQLIGANRRATVEGLQRQPGESNYFIGSNPAKWRTHVPHYAKVRYREIYPGVDLIYYGNPRQLEHDFVLAPGADPRQIRLQVTGAGQVELDAQGALVFRVAGAEMRLKKPEIYQEFGGVRKPVTGGYALAAANRVGFVLGSYDTTKPLVIDPEFVYASYLGGNGNENPGGLAVDAQGNAYVVGATRSLDFPTTGALQPASSGNQDAFVSKFNEDGSALIYSTYIGGGGGDTIGVGIALDSQGSAYAVGTVNTPNFPTTDHAPQRTLVGNPNDAFVSKLSPDGASLVYSTYLGGNGNDRANYVAVDDEGNAVFAGHTGSTDFPLANPVQAAYGGGAFDGFIAKLNAEGTALIYSTYLGGSGEDRAWNVILDGDRNAYAVGRTGSIDFPVRNALQSSYGGDAYDGYVVKMSSDGKLIFSTYFGGSGVDVINGIATDSAGNIYIAGATNSSNLPVVGAFQPSLREGICGSPPRPCFDAFAAKISGDMSTLLYCTYLGGNGDDGLQEGGVLLALDEVGSLYLAGTSDSTDFPSVDAVQEGYGGGLTDAFISKLGPGGDTLLFSSDLGGSGRDQAWNIVLDRAGNIYVLLLTGSMDVPVVNAFQATYGGGNADAFVVKVAQ